MAYYITIDIGNSSAKAAVWLDGKLIGPTLQGRLDRSDLEHLCACINGKFDCAAVCSVADDSTGISAVLSDLSRRVIVVDATIPLPLDLSAYSSGQTLGADRIAAMCGAMSLYPRRELLVVDCGTAVTYDRVDTASKFLGGNIAPGIGMRLRALHSFTARLPEVIPADPDSLWGLSTQQAMLSGAFYGVAAEIAYYVMRAPESTLVLTGGHALNLEKYISAPVTIDPDLVLRGLKHIIEYNEKM